MKTKIRQANWKSKGIFGDKKYMDIVTAVYWQGDDALIDTDSKFFLVPSLQRWHTYTNWSNKKLI